VNAVGWALFALLAAVFLVLRIADVLNLSRLRGDPPDDFRDVFDGATYSKALAYARERLRFGIVEAVFDFVLLLGFWFCGGFGAWDRIVRSAGWGPIPTGLAYIAGLFFAQDSASLPFQVHSVFSIEARFGFNKTTVRTFVWDKVKTWALTALLGGALLSAVLAFFTWAGRGAWAWAWGAATVFSLFAQFVAPTWIMPLFNKFTPLPDGELRTSVFDLARRAEFGLANIFVMDGSRRSSKTNAFFTGFGRTKRIALFDTLIRRHTVPELVSVMAHEIGHYKKRHVLIGEALSILEFGGIFYLLSLFLSIPAIFAAFGAAPSVHVGLALFGVVFSPASFLLGLGLSALSRRHEYEADRFALEWAGGPEPMIAALKKLAADNLSQLMPHPFYVALHYSHPPLPARVAALRRAESGG
jgi:STE24 endopeptidase